MCIVCLSVCLFILIVDESLYVFGVVVLFGLLFSLLLWVVTASMLCDYVVWVCGV